MISKERYIYILSRLNNKPTVSIDELRQELGVSRSTIQRDLDYLQNQGKITRERGGATKVGLDKTISDLNEIEVSKKINVNSQAKHDIGQLAAKEVEDGELIFIDSGTTPMQIIPFLRHKQIKIVTNSNLVLQQLKGLSVEIFMLGGIYNEKNDVNYGPSTIKQIQDFRYDKAFIGANGVDIALQEAYASGIEIGSIKEHVIKRSKQVYLLVDDSKFKLTGLTRFSQLPVFDKIITNSRPEGSDNLDNLWITPAYKK